MAGNSSVAVLEAPQELVAFAGIPAPRVSEGTSYTITAAAAAPGISAGDQFSDLARLSELVAAKFEGLGRGMSEPSQMMIASARPEDWSNAYGNIARSGIASLGFEREHDFVMAHQHDWQVIERACNEARLPGGSLTPDPTSLTAAPGTPGWCAPCTVNYDFCPPAVLDGLVDLPTVVAPRGCLTYPSMPDFGLLYQGTGFCYPAADYDLTANPNVDPVANPYWAKNKPCSLVPCPETQTCTLDPCGVCLQSSILVERAYPELIQFFIQNALVAWGHKMNCRDLTQMITASTAVTVPRPQVGPGAMSSVLEVIEFYATWLRYKYRLGRNSSIEAVLPDWVRGVLRSDIAKRRGVNLLAVTDDQISAWLALRKVRVQWVLGLDEAFCDTTGSTTTPPSQIDPKTSAKFGGNAGALGTTGPTVPPILWPETLSFLMYPAGTFFRARTNLVNIEGGLVDSALLRRNERLLLFVEEATSVCKRCYESLYITMDICPSGQTGGGSISQPVCELLAVDPEITVLGPWPGDPTGMTLMVTVDNHGRGAVTIDPRQTPTTGITYSNPGDGTTVTNVVYTTAGSWQMTATDSSNPAAVGTANVTVPSLPVPPQPNPTVTAIEDPADVTGMTALVTVNNGAFGSVTINWGQTPALPNGTNPGNGTTPTSQLYTTNGTWTITATDANNPAAVGTAQVTIPFP